VNTVMNLRVPQNVGNFVTELLLASQGRLCSIELISSVILKETVSGCGPDSSGKGRDHSEALHVEGKIISECISGK
jgi:hypothetical protein